MDLSTLPDIVQHFSIAVQFVPDAMHQVAEPLRNFSAAFGSDSEYTPREKFYHGSKCLALAGLLGFTIATLNVEGILGTAFAEADELNELYHKGWMARHHHGDAPAPPVA